MVAATLEREWVQAEPDGAMRGGLGVKLLDPVSNRYIAGVVRFASDEEMEIELPATSRLFAGQSVRFVVANRTASPLIARQSMRRALITQVQVEGRRTRVELSVA